ncbi:RecX family transcriptional regulator [Patescibacteria group bacterium]|nr:RecX family transcriptional regulator [Patescibacteria group bacterium]
MPSDIEKALFQTALKYLGYRDRFKKEIETRLKKEIIKRKFPEESLSLIPGILTKLEKAGLINDPELIGVYIKTQQESKLRGPYFIKQKLLQMGAPRDQVNSAIKKICTQESQEIAMEKLLKKHQPDLQDFKARNKFQRFLMYRGFNSIFCQSKIVKCINLTKTTKK